MYPLVMIKLLSIEIRKVVALVQLVVAVHAENLAWLASRLISYLEEHVWIHFVADIQIQNLSVVV